MVYACETWGAADFKRVEVLYRQGLKTALSVRSGVNNEIVYTESGELPLKIRITKQQLKFWLTLQDYLKDKPLHYISKLITTANANNVRYIMYYNNLQELYVDTTNCINVMKKEYETKFSQSFRDAFQSDENSRLGAYLHVNPSLTRPMYDNKLEFQRIRITRYRTGSHNLSIEKGRMYGNVAREQRLCACNMDVQSLKHVLLDCQLLNEIRMKYGVTDVEKGVMNDCFLVEMEHILGIK